MKIAPPPKSDFGFFNGYIFRIPDTDLATALYENWIAIKTLAESLTDDDLAFRYDTGKWSLKEIFIHFIDAERNYSYRIMRISRGDHAQLPAINVDDFILNAHAAERSMANIMQELELLRKATITMFEGMHGDMLDKTGPARDTMVSVRALGFAIPGHAMHHFDIIRERYLPALNK